MPWSLASLLALGLAPTPPAGAATSARCMARFQAEQARIEREFARQRPAPGDTQAHQAWMARLMAELETAAREAERCEHANQPPWTDADRARLDACLAETQAQFEAMQRRDAGRTLSPAEQAARRAEDEALLQRRRACERRP